VVTRAATQLQAGFVQLDVPVQSAGGELPAARVDGELAITRDTRAALNEFGRLAAPAQPERLQPQQRQDAPAVIDLGDIDIARGQTRRTGPEHAARGVDAGGGSNRLEKNRWMAGIGRRLAARDDQHHRTVDGRIAVIEAQRLRDHPCPEVVVHRQRLPVDGVRVARGILPGDEGDLCQLLAGRAVLVEIALGQQPTVAGMTDAERHRELAVTLHARRVVVDRCALAHHRRRASHVHLVGRLPH
jgi:hypothetical protein